MSPWSSRTHLKRGTGIFTSVSSVPRRCERPDAGLSASARAAPLLPRGGLVYFRRTGREIQMLSWGPHNTELLMTCSFLSFVLRFPVTAVLADSLEMWDMAMDAEDSMLKPLSKPEPPQTPTISVLKNHMETQNRIPQSLCHQTPQAQSGPWHLQTSSLNQHATGSRVF